jgi:hypothetical protein
VPSHEGIFGNEVADQLARTGSEYLFTGTEPACSISIGVAMKAVRDWTNRNHQKYWESFELPQKRSETGQTEIIKNIGNP